MKQKITTIKSIDDVKTGVSKRTGNSWTLSNVVDNDDVKYGTFDGFKYRPFIGKEITLFFEEEPWEKGDKKGINRKLVSPNNARQPSRQAKDYSTDLSRMEKKLDEIIFTLNAMSAELTPIIQKEANKDIPF